VDEKFIPPHPQGVRIRNIDVQKGSATFFAQYKGKIVGVFSGLLDTSDLHLPSDKVFEPELSAMRQNGSLLCELSNQAILPQYRSSSIATDLMRCVFGFMVMNQVTTAIASVSPYTKGFYETMGFEQVGTVRNYAADGSDPVILMVLNEVQNRWTAERTSQNDKLTFWHQFYYERNPYWHYLSKWQSEVEQNFDEDTYQIFAFDNQMDDPYLQEFLEAQQARAV
jgi:ribosomal protein S18 acetylase RimI-like enzyme